MKKLFALLLSVSLVISLVIISAFADISVVLDGVELEFDVSPVIIDNRTMVPMRAIFEALGLDAEWDIVDNYELVPLRAISEAAGATVDWNGYTRTVTIVSVSGEGDDSIGAMFDVRHNFEQRSLPFAVFQNEENIINIINSGYVEEVERFVVSAWEAALNVDEHILGISIERIDSYTNAVIIELYYTELPMLSSFIGIAYNELQGLYYFILEKDFEIGHGHHHDDYGHHGGPHLLTFLTSEVRGTLFSAENNRDSFIEAIRFAMGRLNAEAPVDNPFQRITAQQAYEMMNELEDFILVDVRTEREFMERRIDGAILMPDFDIADMAPVRLPDMNAVIIVYCRTGGRSANVARMLANMGYTNVYDMGGIVDWHF